MTASVLAGRTSDLYPLGRISHRISTIESNAAIDASGVEVTRHGTVAAAPGSYRTSRERIFACGDMRRGQSLVVWAIREGRECADAVNACLIAERSAQHATA